MRRPARTEREEAPHCGCQARSAVRALVEAYGVQRKSTLVDRSRLNGLRHGSPAPKRGGNGEGRDLPADVLLHGMSSNRARPLLAWQPCTNLAQE